MRIIDMINSPSYNHVTNQSRGEWSLRDVSNGEVFINSTWNKPDCIDHGAMNCVNEELTIWRCLICSRSCYDMDNHQE